MSPVAAHDQAIAGKPADRTGEHGVAAPLTMASSTPGTGRPTVVATSSSDDVSVVPVPKDDSVDVYRTTTGTPKRRRISATMAAEVLAVPVAAHGRY